MSRTLVGAVVLLAFGCSEAPLPLQVQDVPAPSFAATTTTTNISLPFNRPIFNPCVPELVDVTGSLHFLLHVTSDGNGGFHRKIHFQPQGHSGVGRDTGTRYRGVGVTQRTLNLPSNGSHLETFINNFRLIGAGGAKDNLHVHQTIHTTVNANGEVTATVANTSVTCR